ncbi:glycosyltransferase [Pediococcus inopinatus]|uniref:Glycosyltransferase n=1 Tax=Pediococcus inopinatus TaxID=114090 RepID=A0ABZ0Q727_9LACO|nr:glycosyltransferase family 2 protein [Pediococcus inopinatus]WPC22383.1 glycosyltransferase [Pediococcus inopinatus]
MKLSVVIPIYNSENYISRCLESIMNQTFNDYEIIIVDDGSTDNSKLIINRYVLKDERIKYFYIKNHGVSHARNIGIETSSGKYLMFIDADDYCDENYFSNMVNLIQHLQVDVAMSNFYLVQNKNIYPNKLPRLQNKSGILTSDQATTLILLDNGFKGFVWNKIYKRSVVDNLRFDSRYAYLEDMLFNIKVFKNCKNIGYNDSINYYYCQNIGSASSELNQDFYSVSMKIRNIISTKNRYIVDSNILYNLVFQGKSSSKTFITVKNENRMKNIRLYNPVKNLIIKTSFVNLRVATWLARELQRVVTSKAYFRLRKFLN